MSLCSIKKFIIPIAFDGLNVGCGTCRLKILFTKNYIQEMNVSSIIRVQIRIEDLYKRNLAPVIFLWF